MDALEARTKDAEASSRSKVRGIQAFVAVCLVLCALFTSLRFYVRLRIIRGFRKDDWAVVATLFLMVGSGITAAVATNYGLGSHMSILSHSEKVFCLVLVWVASAGYLATVTVLKSAFLLQYRRAFPLPTFQRLCDIFLGFLGAWLLSGLITHFAICLPIADQWDPAISENGESCRARYNFWLANGIIHVATDLVLFLMPLPMIRKLPLITLHKLALGAVFSLGFFTCAISVIRLTTLHGALLGTDPSWSMATTLYWSVGEATCAILCLCVPTLRPLLVRKKRCELRSTSVRDLGQRPDPAGTSLNESDAATYHAALRQAETFSSTELPLQ